jgi:hypothetical protein
MVQEQPPEGLKNGALPCRLKGFNEKQLAGGLIGHGQGVTILTVSKLELAFEIRAP